MPAFKAKNKSKKAIQDAVSKNMRELYKANQMRPEGKKRSPAQMQAIAFSQARGGKKKKK